MGCYWNRSRNHPSEPCPHPHRNPHSTSNSQVPPSYYTHVSRRRGPARMFWFVVGAITAIEVMGCLDRVKNGAAERLMYHHARWHEKHGYNWGHGDWGKHWGRDWQDWGSHGDGSGHESWGYRSKRSCMLSGKRTVPEDRRIQSSAMEMESLGETATEVGGEGVETNGVAKPGHDPLTDKFCELSEATVDALIISLQRLKTRLAKNRPPYPPTPESTELSLPGTPHIGDATQTPPPPYSRSQT